MCSRAESKRLAHRLYLNKKKRLESTATGESESPEIFDQGKGITRFTGQL